MGLIYGAKKFQPNSANFDLVLEHRLRRCTNIKPTLAVCVLCEQQAARIYIVFWGRFDVYFL